jgi:glycolate oxidase subunit GlcD
MTTDNLEAQLKRSIRRGRVLTAPAQLAGYDTDGLGYKTFRPDAVVIPADAEELVQLLRDSKELGVPVTIRGAGTSLSGGPVAAQGGVVVHTSSLKKVRTVCREGYWCEVESSVVLNQLDATLLPYGLFYPPDPSSGPVCTLGGNIAMNAGGAHCFRYGVTSNYVLGLEVVLLDGSVHRFGGPAGGRGAVKLGSGESDDWREDWKRLMVGSEGTLGAFTRFWLRLLPRPEKVWTYRATFLDLQSAERAVHALAIHASFPVAIELMDPRCVAMVENSPMAVGLPKDSFLIVTEIDGPEVLVDARAKDVANLLQNAGASSVEYSDDEATRKGLWKARKVAGGLMGQLSPDFLVQDAVIPKRALAELLQLVYDEADAAGLPAVNVFHAGDGNLHPNFLFDSSKPGEIEKVDAISKRLMQRVVEVGGTLSGEHGIGNDKTAYMSFIFDEHTLRLQLAVPSIFNPKHQLNPLKVFASRRFDTRRISVPLVSQNHKSDATSHAATHNSAEAYPTKQSTPRLFEPFFDSIDGVVCGPATMTASDLEVLRTQHRFRFPLFLDQRRPLNEQVASSNFASSSSRFGPYCDNIMGMNWKLPSGRIVRIGERVVKSTTGYDLLRFLLHSEGRFGEPVDFVLRLRPDCGKSGVFWLAGTYQAVSQAVAGLLATCWIHWFDAVDVLFEGAVDGNSETCRARIALNCPAEEWPVYEQFLTSFAATHGLERTSDSRTPLMPDGCPDFALKTTPDQGIKLAREISSDNSVKCIALCYNGVVHGYLNQPATDPRSQITNIIQRHSQALHDVGGDWQSRHIPSEAPTGVEAEWLKLLEQEFASV